MPWLCHIEFLSGKDTGRRVTFDLRTTPKVVIGSDAGAELTVDEAGVERRHAALKVDGAEEVLHLHDSSRAGTYLNGNRVYTAELKDRQEIRLGKAGPVLRVTMERMARERTAAAVAPAVEMAGAQVGGGGGRKPWLVGGAVAVVLLLGWLVLPASSPPTLVTQVSKPEVPLEVSARFAAMEAELQRTRQQMQNGLFDAEEATAGVKREVATRKGDGAAFAEVARKYEKAVALVVGAGGSVTAFAIGPSVFATNSHVSEPVKAALANGDDCWVVLNKGGGERFRIVRAVVHPQYGNDPGNGLSIYDVGLLYVDGKASVWLSPAEDATLEGLDAGHPVSYIGFPSEGLKGGNVDMDDPIGTMKTGIVTSVSGWDLRDAGASGNVLIRHDMGSAGGASGSPVLDQNGAVVGIHNAGNYFFLSDAPRIPNAAGINFAQRVDCLRAIWPEYPGQPPPSP